VIGAVDIGGTKIAVGMVDNCGQIFNRLGSPTDAEHGFEHGLERIQNMLRRSVQLAGGSLTGIGIGCTGPVDPFAGTIGKVDFLPGWDGKDLVGELRGKFQVQVAMENDADAAALAESRWGSGRGKRRFIFVTVGTGIGGGIVFHGRLYRGVDRSHPEIGHHVVDPSGPACFCGARGCWESLASGPAMLDWMRSKMPAALLCNCDLTAERICKLAREGDRLACEAVEREGYYLGLGLANLVTLFAPDVIALGGGVMRSADLFLRTIRETISQNCGLVPFAKTDLKVANLGADVALAGAAEVWRHRFYSKGLSSS
jgi:glucokinase